MRVTPSNASGDGNRGDFVLEGRRARKPRVQRLITHASRVVAERGQRDQSFGQAISRLHQNGPPARILNKAFMTDPHEHFAYQRPVSSGLESRICLTRAT